MRDQSVPSGTFIWPSIVPTCRASKPPPTEPEVRCGPVRIDPDAAAPVAWRTDNLEPEGVRPQLRGDRLGRRARQLSVDMSAS